MPDQPREEARRFKIIPPGAGIYTPVETVSLDPLRSLADEWEAEAAEVDDGYAEWLGNVYRDHARQLRERIGDA